MSGERDLDVLIASMEPVARPDAYVMVSLPSALPASVPIAAMIDEGLDGMTYVLTRADADAAGLRYDFVAGWITLTVHSSLEAVGLTAAFSSALGAAGISCNVIAGFFHDHLLVPIERVDDALECLRALARSAVGRAT